MASTVVTALAVAAASAFTVGLFGNLKFDDAGARAAVETFITLAALISAGLLMFCFEHRGRQQELLLLCALVGVTVTDFTFSTLPALLGVTTVGSGIGARLACEVIVAAAFAAGAFSPKRLYAIPPRRLMLLAGASAIAIVALGEVLGLFLVGIAAPEHLAGLTSAASGRVAMVVHLIASGILFASGVAFTRRAQLGDTDQALLAAAAFVLSAVRLQYVVVPAVGADWVTLGDGLRVVSYSLMLAVALRRYAQTRHELSRAALKAQRERIARDLHDGLAQDLAFIAAYGQRLHSELGPEHPLTVAARRAVAASRGTIVDLSAADAPSTAAALRQVADELAARFQVRVDVHVVSEGGDDLHSSDREELVRIAREAIVNAIRHGGARAIDVTLERNHGQLRLRVGDDGCGIPDHELITGGGFGLPTMRARAAALGGRLITRRSGRGGTELEVHVS